MVTSLLGMQWAAVTAKLSCRNRRQVPTISVWAPEVTVRRPVAPRGSNGIGTSVPKARQHRNKILATTSSSRRSVPQPAF